MSSGNISQEANVLFQDNLNITDIDPEGKRFDRGTIPMICKTLSRIIKPLISITIGRPFDQL